LSSFAPDYLNRRAEGQNSEGLTGTGFSPPYPAVIAAVPDIPYTLNMKKVGKRGYEYCQRSSGPEPGCPEESQMPGFLRENPSGAGE